MVGNVLPDEFQIDYSATLLALCSLQSNLPHRQKRGYFRGNTTLKKKSRSQSVEFQEPCSTLAARHFFREKEEWFLLILQFEYSIRVLGSLQQTKTLIFANKMSSDKSDPVEFQNAYCKTMVEKMRLILAFTVGFNSPKHSVDIMI